MRKQLYNFLISLQILWFLGTNFHLKHNSRLNKHPNLPWPFLKMGSLRLHKCFCLWVFSNSNIMYVPCSPRNDDVECIVVICTLLNHSLKATILYQRICLGCHLIPEIIVYFLQVIDLEMAASTEIVPFKDLSIYTRLQGCLKPLLSLGQSSEVPWMSKLSDWKYARSQ